VKQFKETLLKIKDQLEQLRLEVEESTPPSKPKEIKTKDLEGLGLISKEVVSGQPVLNIHPLDSCGYNGCIPSESHIHTITTIEQAEDLKLVYEENEKGELEPLKDENGEDIYKTVYLNYSMAKTCPHCGLINRYLMRLKNSGIGADAMNKHLYNYEFESEELKAKTKAFMNQEIRGGLLWGRAGNGKTHLLSAVARELIFNNYKVRYVSHQYLLESIKRSFDGEVDPRTKWLDGVDFILFDELGFCPKTDWAKQTTNELIHAAHAADVKILFASNLSPDQLKRNLLDMRTSSRMGELVGQFVYNMRGQDRRGAF